MKWLFRGILAILLTFIVCCVIGFFLPAKQIIETHLSVDSYPEDVFAELSDLRGYPAWFHDLDKIDASQIIYAGTERGLGQSAAWRQSSKRGEIFGNLKILQSQTDELVSLRHEYGPKNIDMTYALQIDETDQTVLLLARYEKLLGDFPYLSRLRAKLAEGKTTKDLNASLQKLKKIIEVNAVE